MTALPFAASENETLGQVLRRALEQDPDGVRLSYRTQFDGRRSEYREWFVELSTAVLVTELERSVIAGLLPREVLGLLSNTQEQP